MSPTAGTRLIAAIRRRPILVLVTFVVPVLLGWVYVFSLPTSYAVNGVISFQPRIDENNGRDLTALLARRYPVVAQSEQSVGAAATAAGVSNASLQNGLSALVAAETLNLTLTVTLDSSSAAVAGAQSVFQSVLAANTADPFLQAIPVQPPTVAHELPGPPRLFLALVMVVLAAIVAALAAMVAAAYFGDDR
jgi:hypothetical protein